MQSVRRVVEIALVVLNTLLAFLGLAISAFSISAFADGNDILERLPMLVHPITAVLLILLVFMPSRRIAIAAVALIVLNIIADGAVAYAAASGVAEIQWFLPLIFSVAPLLMLPRAISAAKTR